jgi:hypothetical protein
MSLLAPGDPDNDSPPAPAIHRPVDRYRAARRESGSTIRLGDHEV